MEQDKSKEMSAIQEEELKLKLQNEKDKLEDMNALRDAQRNMAWFSLFGMLLYPVLIVICNIFGLMKSVETLGDLAGTYFVSVAAIVAAFYGKSAYEAKNDR